VGALFGILTEGSAILIALVLDFNLSAASSDTAQCRFFKQPSQTTMRNDFLFSFSKLCDGGGK
jgi:hypothetical protein